MPRYKYTEEDIKAAVESSFSCAEVLRKIGMRQSGGGQSHIQRRITNAGYDTAHWTRQAHNKGIRSPRRLKAEEILIRTNTGQRTKVVKLRRALDDVGVPRVCVDCGVGEMWNGAPLQLEIDHIDRDWENNEQSNLRYICPNCHSQYGSVKERAVKRMHS